MRLLTSIVFLLILLITITPLCYGDSLTLEWNPNGEEDLAGYYVYYGTTPETYGTPIDVENVTEYELTGLDTGVRYYVAITAYDTSDNESEKSDEESGVPSHTQNPTTTTSVPATTTTPGTTTSISGTTTIPGTTTTVQPVNNSLNGKIIINNGESVTDSPQVTLTLFASVNDPPLATGGPIITGSELGSDARMCISNDGQKWSSLEPYRQTKQWTLEPGDGVKTVYAQFCDSNGRWMIESAQAQITLEGSQSTCVDPQKLQPLSVTASSASPRYSADNLIDGDPSTAWSSVISLFKKDQYITLDLGATKKISGLTMYSSQLFGVDFFPTNFAIQVSQDSATWVDINREQGYVFGQSSSSDNWEMNSLEFRYIRIHITKSKTLFLLFKLAQIAEIEVHGCNPTGEIPLLAGEQLSGEGGEQHTVNTQKVSNRETENRNMALSSPGRPAITFLK